MLNFERIGSETIWEGKIATVRVDSFRYADGGESEREIVAHPGAVAIVAHDGERIFLVRQPREAVGEPALLELPAGKLDERGRGAAGRPPSASSPRRSARAPLAGGTCTSFYTSPGFADEECHLYLATGPVRRRSRDADENERIEIVTLAAGRPRRRDRAAAATPRR